jgi:branched-chain amino acid transport system permease protein
MSAYAIYLVVLVLQLAMLAQASDALGGHGGRVGVSSVLFATFGGYGYAFATVVAGVDPATAILLTTLGALAIGVPLGLLLLRLREDDYLLGTLAAQLGAVELINNLPLLGGPLGIRSVPGFGSSLVGGLFVVVLAAAIGGFVLFRMLGRRNRLRESLHWLRDDTPSAFAVGISQRAVWIRVVAAQVAISAVVGMSIVIVQGYASPTTFGLSLSIAFLTTIYLGGTGASPLAMYLGAALLVALGEFVRSLDLPANWIGPFQQIVMASLLIAVLALRGRGLMGPKIEVGPSASRLE